jgi:DNA mismatch endonuclease (patch repair protein)
MSRVRSRDTAPELLVRRILHARGYRYRLHRRDLPGRPDIVLPRHRAAVFVNGCFWHGHGCSLFRMPATRTDFWATKNAVNRARDAAARAELRAEGWRILDVWECALKGRRRLNPDVLADGLVDFVSGTSVRRDIAGEPAITGQANVDGTT